MIASLRKELQETHSKCSAMEQENALLENEVERLNRKLGTGKNVPEKDQKTDVNLKYIRKE